MSDQIAAAEPRVSASQTSEKASVKSDANVKVRLAVKSDEAQIKDLAKRFHQTTVFGDIPFSDEKWDKSVAELLTGPAHKSCLVVEIEGSIIGAAYASVGEYFIGEGTLITTIHFLAIDPRLQDTPLSGRYFILLLDGLKQWGQARGSEKLLLHVTTGKFMKSTDRLLRAYGAKMIGGNYAIS